MNCLRFYHYGQVNRAVTVSVKRIAAELDVGFVFRGSGLRIFGVEAGSPAESAVPSVASLLKVPHSVIVVGAVDGVPVVSRPQFDALLLRRLNVNVSLIHRIVPAIIAEKQALTLNPDVALQHAMLAVGSAPATKPPMPHHAIATHHQGSSQTKRTIETSAIIDTLKRFIGSTETQCVFPVTLSPADRFAVHKQAEQLRLRSHSVGEAPSRYIFVTR